MSNGDEHPDQPTFSVVTIVLNAGKKLDRTIQSVLAQDFRGFEYIVVDGGSGDGTPDILKKYDESIDYWVSEPDNGISDAFNKGIGLARGEIIGILNAGDWYEPDALAAVYQAYRSNPSSDILCGSIEFWEENQPVLFCRSEPRLIERGTSIYHPAVFVKRSAYQARGLYDTALRFAMDYELLLRFGHQGAQFQPLEKKLANMSLDGVSRSNWYAGLKEVRGARASYYSWPNVLYHHTVAVVKNLLVIWMKTLGLGSLYRLYWHHRNNQRSHQGQG